VDFIKIVKKLFQIGKKNTRIMYCMATIYNMFSFTKRKIKGKNNIISKKTAFFRNNKITICGSNNKLCFGIGTRLINCNIYIYGDNNILEIGDNCYCENSEFYYEDYDCKIDIGYKTNTLGVHFAVTEPHSKIIVGKECLFSSDVEIRTGDSHSIINIVTNKRTNYAKNVIIENHVWVGAHSRLLKGCKISRDSIVANSAIVTKEFNSSNCIIGGFPAKLIKENVNWINERIYDNQRETE